MDPTEPPAAPPHPMMPDLYRDPAQKREWLRRIFNETAPDYDRVESWLSLRSGRWHRRRSLVRAGLAGGMSVADVACGTGLLAREALAIVGERGSVVGIDPSPGMLAVARRALGIPTVEGVAEALPFPDRSFDFVCMGYALRHVADLGAAFREFRRVLRPGGAVCLLEISRPARRAPRALLRAYMFLHSELLLRFTRVAPRTPELWRYYARTIDACIPPAGIVEAMRNAGFDGVRHRSELGVFSAYTGSAAPHGEETSAEPQGPDCSARQRHP
ncbi:MAG: class I SAM-dependent methyltransferase [Phycisphaerales bacterium]